jgi:hypothetical protein
MAQQGKLQLLLCCAHMVHVYTCLLYAASELPAEGAHAGVCGKGVPAAERGRATPKHPQGVELYQSTQGRCWGQLRQWCFMVGHAAMVLLVLSMILNVHGAGA